MCDGIVLITKILKNKKKAIIEIGRNKSYNDVYHLIMKHVINQYIMILSIYAQTIQIKQLKLNTTTHY
jgi:hypothetical protein